jgi:hypothetical protein
MVNICRGVDFMADEELREEYKKVKVHNVRTLPQSHSFAFPQILGPVINAKVVLSELLVQINVEADLELPEEAIEIKREKKAIEITQCELLLNTNTVFIGGFVNKNIEYATGQHSCGNNTWGHINHISVKIPFESTAEIPTLQIPIGLPTRTDEYYLHAPKFSKLKVPNKEFVTTEFINEKPFGEPVMAYMVDEIIHSLEKPFHQFTEKMVVVVVLKIMQNRQVPLYGFFGQTSPVNLFQNQNQQNVFQNQQNIQQTVVGQPTQQISPTPIIGELLAALGNTEA